MALKKKLIKGFDRGALAAVMNEFSITQKKFCELYMSCSYVTFSEICSGRRIPFWNEAEEIAKGVQVLRNEISEDKFINK